MGMRAPLLRSSSNPGAPANPTSDLAAIVATVVAVLVAAAPTVAAVITYTDETTWQAAVSGEESFDLAAADLYLAEVAVEPTTSGDIPSSSDSGDFQAFFGVTSDVPFDRVVYDEDPGGDDIGIGELQLAAVPQPRTALLLGLGLAGLAALGSPRQRTQR